MAIKQILRSAGMATLASVAALTATFGVFVTPAHAESRSWTSNAQFADEEAVVCSMNSHIMSIHPYATDEPGISGQYLAYQVELKDVTPNLTPSGWARQNRQGNFWINSTASGSQASYVQPQWLGNGVSYYGKPGHRYLVAVIFFWANPSTGVWETSDLNYATTGDYTTTLNGFSYNTSYCGT